MYSSLENNANIIPTERERLIWLMDLLLKGELSVERFCAEYEHTWNFEVDEDDLSREEAPLFEELFKVAAWYTHVIEDRKNYSGFKSESDVLDAVVRARQVLRSLERSTS